jgi:hypothetical protein
MTESDRRLLTEYLGECCLKGNKTWVTVSVFPLVQKLVKGDGNRTFTTPADFFAVFSRLVEKGDIKEFFKFAFNHADKDEEMSMFGDEDMNGENTFYDEDFIVWIHGKLPDGTYRLCQLCAGWLKEKEG